MNQWDIAALLHCLISTGIHGDDVYHAEQALAITNTRQYSFDEMLAHNKDMSFRTYELNVIINGRGAAVDALSQLLAHAHSHASLTQEPCA